MDRNISICNCLKSFSFVGHKLFPKQSCWHHIIWWGKLSGGRHEKNISLFRSAMWKLHITKLLAVYFSLEFRHSINETFRGISTGIYSIQQPFCLFQPLNWYKITLSWSWMKLYAFKLVQWNLSMHTKVVWKRNIFGLIKLLMSRKYFDISVCFHTLP